MTTKLTTTNGTLTYADVRDPTTLERGTLEQNAAAVYLASLESTHSRRTMLQALDRIAGLLAEDVGAFALPWAQLRFQHTTAIRSKLAELYAPATANKMLSALRGVLGAAFDLGQMSAEDYTRAVRTRGIKGQTLPAGRCVSLGELTALMTACGNDQGPAGVRDGAMIAILYSCGLRRAELVGLEMADYDQVSGALTVRGKRNKERLVYVQNGAADALEDWLIVRGHDDGPMFCPMRRGGHMQSGRRLTTQALYKMLRKRAGQAGVHDVSPHDLRRTFVSDLLDAGADISTVQKLAGHANVTTTQRYDRRPEEAKRRAAALLHVPYRRRTLDDGTRG